MENLLSRHFGLFKSSSFWLEMVGTKVVGKQPAPELHKN